MTPDRHTMTPIAPTTTLLAPFLNTHLSRLVRMSTVSRVHVSRAVFLAGV